MNDPINSSVGQSATVADISAYQPPTQAVTMSSPVNTAAASSAPATGSTPATANTLESQNIFDLLGVNDGGVMQIKKLFGRTSAGYLARLLDNDSNCY
jgi:hypothetical protein